MNARPPSAARRQPPALHRPQPGRSLLLVSLLCGLAAGCGSSSGPPSSAAGPAARSASATPVTTPAAPAASAPSPGQVLVARPDAVPPAQRLQTRAVPFDAPASYPDGIALSVRDVTHAVTTQTGVGAQPGQAVTTFVLEVSNGSPAPLDLSGVVLSVTVGADRLGADPVYGGGQEDFSGILDSGARTSAVYTFAIPERAREDVTLTMDFDGRHAPAVWRGSVT